MTITVRDFDRVDQKDQCYPSVEANVSLIRWDSTQKPDKGLGKVSGLETCVIHRYQDLGDSPPGAGGVDHVGAAVLAGAGCAAVCIHPR